MRAYELDIAAFERHIGSSARVAEIDRDAIVAFMEDQRAGGLASASLRRRASGLRGFCSWLRTHGLLDSDPWQGTTVAAGRSRKLPRVLATHELDRLLRYLNDRAGASEALGGDRVAERPQEWTTLLAVGLMVATGVRVHEVVGVNCRDVDLGAGTVRILGKGRRERHVFLPNAWIKDLTADYIEARARLGVDHTKLLFNSRLRPLTTDAMRARLAAAARDAGLAARVTPHTLRHTAATQLIEAGVDIRYIQRLLGHASLTTTAIYTHVYDGALKRVITDADVLGRLLERR